MKKTFLLILSLLLAFLLTACGTRTVSPPQAESAPAASSKAASAESENISENTGPASQAEEPSREPEESAEPKSGSRVLVVYFSRTGEQYGVGVIDKGNTAIVAEDIADAAGADLYEILPAEDGYPMEYDALTEVAKQEQNENARPAIAGEFPDLSGYDTIFVGAPVWWGDWPMICYTFFENAQLNGKAVYPFSTHAGSGLSGFDTKLQNAVPGCTVGQGLAIRGADCQKDPDLVRADVENWLAALGYGS